MKYSDCVGRVGALAVTLGIGAATMALSGAAWAQPGDSGAAGGAGSEGRSADTSAPGAESTETSMDSTPDAADQSTDEQDADPDDESASEADDEESDADEGDIEEVGDIVADTSEPDADRAGRSYGSKDDEPSEEDGADRATGVESDPTEPEAVELSDAALADTEDVEEAPTVVAASQAATTTPDTVADVDPDSTPVPTGAVTSLSSTATPPTTPTPATATGGPASDSPLAWTLLAFARRQFGQPGTRLGYRTPEATSDMVAAASDGAPLPGDVTHGDPGIFTGSVTGRVSATDPDGGWLIFTGSTTTDKGTVAVLPWGSFIYRPSAAARHAAAADDAIEADKVASFTVTVTDSTGLAATTVVTLDISPANAVPFGTRARVGAPGLTTGSAVVAVSGYDLDGDNLTVTGPASTDKGILVDNGDGTFTYTPTAAAREAAGQPGAPASATVDTVTFTVSDGHGGVRTVSAEIVVTPYAETSANTPGKAAGPVVVSGTGTIYQVTYDVDPTTKLPTRTRVSVLDEDGQVLRSTDSLNGVPVEQAAAVARSDGSLVLTTYNSSTNTTTISIVDGQAAVTRVGTVIGQPSAPLTVAANGATYLQTRQFTTTGDRLVRISATDRLRVFGVGTAGGALVVAPDGSGYLTSVSSFFGARSLLAVGPDGYSRRVALPSGTSTPSDAVIGADGRAYYTAAREFLGDTETLVYTFTGTSSTRRVITGAPARAEVVTGEGVYQATYDADTGTTYISKITADSIETSDAIEGFVLNGISVTPEGTVYVAVRDLGTQTDRVAVVSGGGAVTMVDIPGSIVGLTPSVPGGDTGAVGGEDGYVAYTSDGRTFLAVLGADGSVVRTVALPEGGVVTDPVNYGPDGTPYQVIRYLDAEGRVTSEAVLALDGDALTTTLPGSPLRPNFPAVQFGPDGTGFLVTVEAGQAIPDYHVLGFDQNGDTVVSLDASGWLVPHQLDYVYHQVPLVFGPDRTGYLTLSGADAGVWALTSSGASKVLDLDLGLGAVVHPVSFAADGTPLVTVSELVGDQYVTTVTTFATPTALV